MRALTLRPWWAHAVAHLGKKVENRTRPIPPALIGQRIAIHAGAPARSDAWVGALEEASPAGVSVRTWPSDGLVKISPWGCMGLLGQEMATRSIVATAVLGGEWRDRMDETLFPDWAEVGMHWWALDGVHTLVTPIPVARGQLGLWRLDEETARKVRSAEVRDGE